jgi:hypothetical protein
VRRGGEDFFKDKREGIKEGKGKRKEIVVIWIKKRIVEFCNRMIPKQLHDYFMVGLSFSLDREIYEVRGRVLAPLSYTGVTKKCRSNKAYFLLRRHIPHPVLPVSHTTGRLKLLDTQ